MLLIDPQAHPREARLIELRQADVGRLSDTRLSTLLDLPDELQIGPAVAAAMRRLSQQLGTFDPFTDR